MSAGWMVVAAALFGAMGVLVKLAALRFSSAELVFYRSIFGLVSIWLVVALRTGRTLAPFATRHVAAHLWRGLAGFFALLLFFHAIGRLPLAAAVTLNYTAPLFLAGLTAYGLGERHGRGLLAAVAVGFAGVVLLLRPVLDGRDALPAAAGLASGFLAALAYLNVRRLGRLGEPEWRVVFYFTLLSTVLGFVWMLASTWHAPRLRDLPELFAIGLTATLAQLALTRAYHRGRTLTVGALAYSTVAFAAVYGVALFDERLPPAAWAGIALIVLAGVVAVRASSPPAANPL
jgi:drug/metabolite transporter (DMT)-like permease